MSGEQERYIPNAYDYAKAEWMAEGLSKPAIMLIRCPTCDSPDPRAHPAVSGGGEVTNICPDPYHLPVGRDITGIYNTMVSRNPDGSDPLVQEPKGKP